MTVGPVVVASRYRLGRTLGVGGMGRVFLARDTVLDRDVAIKEIKLPADLVEADREAVQERTLREARAAARISHPNAAQVYDVLAVDGVTWIVMEYVPSRSLQDVIAQDGPIEPRRVAEIGLAVLAALDAAHRAGVRHRDVKPANVLMGDDGRVVLTDFGIATIEGDGIVTSSDMVLGSPQFMSPERVRYGTTLPASDLWSLGATLYTAVEGHSPYERASVIETLTAVAADEPEPAQRAGVLGPVLEGLLRKDPVERIDLERTREMLEEAASDEPAPGRSRWPWGNRRDRGPSAPDVAPDRDAAPTPGPAPVMNSAPAPDAAPVVDSAPAPEAVRASDAPPPAPDPAPAAPSVPEASAAPEAESAPSPSPAVAAAASASVVPRQRVPAETETVTDPEPASRPTGTRHSGAAPRRRRTLLAAGAAALVLAGGGTAWYTQRDTTENPVRSAPTVAATASASPPAASGSPATTPGSPAGVPGGSAPAAPSATPVTSAPTGQAGTPVARPALPSGWRDYRDPTGFRVYVPKDWKRTQEGTIVYFRDGRGHVLGIDQTNKPRPDPVADWRGKARDRVAAGDFPGYDEIKIKSVPYWQEAADWEFTFNGSRSRQHVNNRGVITSKRQAYGIYWQTPDSRWKADRDDLQLVFDSFRPRPS